MKKFLIASLFACAFAVSAYSANLYILYDPACMDRLEYTYLNNENGAPYISYHVTSIPGEKIILDVGTESDVVQTFPPAQFIRCNNAVFDEKLVNDINSNIDRVFIVVKKGENSYQASPIIYAARYLRAEDYILYDSPKYRFQFDLKMGTIGENIALRNPKATVYFEGRLENDCTGAYLFTQNAEFAGNPHTDLVLVPEVGIVEERSGINVEDALKNTLTLTRVNGKKLDRYLKKICKGIDEPEPTLADNGQSGEFITVGANQPASNTEVLTPRSAEALQTAAGAASTTHTVEKGETLYRISKKYGVTVAQLQAWNNKGKSTTIFKGEKLQVAPASSTTPTTTANLTAKDGAIVSVLPQSFENSGATSTAMTKQQRLSAAAQAAATSTASSYHVVAAGETAASIAMRYGYTEARFRQFNNLGKYDVVKIGQALKISDCDCPDNQPASSYQSSGTYTNTQPATANQGLLYARSPQATTTTTPTEMNYTASKAPETESFTNDAFNRTTTTDNTNFNTPYFLDRIITPATTTAAPTEPAESYSYTGNRLTDTGAAGQAQASYPSTLSAANLPIGYSDASSAGNTNIKSGERSYYIVKEGDTLFRIARMYGVTVEHLRSVNNLGAAEVIIPYQKIYLN
ncbi:MAG: LysM peptidoglycan-binding domain-containing protein [Phaeodactylibacter sp.]|nr:LysM peptidoglycan-binding domain-containing protein [Phaeodactylibacter sp.]MCB9274343.1 LysM peptidoglycan-binding domain-containing protein [Lewinellaceae bacterium]